jgi:hypothetical protein
VCRTRNGRNEFLGVGMIWCSQHLFRHAALYDLPGAHDQHALADTAHHRQIMAYEEVCHCEFVAQFGKQVEDDRLHTDIQRRRRLIKNEKARTQRNCVRDADAGFFAAPKAGAESD